MKPAQRALLLTIIAVLLLPTCLRAQSYEEYGEYRVDWGGYLFGLKGGLSMGNQDWSGLETEFLFGTHVAAFYETIPANNRFSLYAQLGYHTRGSKIKRSRALTPGGQAVTLPADDFRFYNVSLGVGAKSVIGHRRYVDLYYTLGLRVEYSISNNLSDYDALEDSYGIGFRRNYPFDSPDYVNDIVYGASFGGGASFPLFGTTGAFVELTGNPDLNFQYNQGPIDNIITSPGAGTRTIPARMIRNFTIELSVGIRFLRQWDYID